MKILAHFREGMQRLIRSRQMIAVRGGVVLEAEGVFHLVEEFWPQGVDFFHRVDALILADDSNLPFRLRTTEFCVNCVNSQL